MVLSRRRVALIVGHPGDRLWRCVGNLHRLFDRVVLFHCVAALSTTIARGSTDGHGKTWMEACWGIFVSAGRDAGLLTKVMLGSLVSGVIADGGPIARRRTSRSTGAADDASLESDVFGRCPVTLIVIPRETTLLTCPLGSHNIRP
jgi:hypothetical protein